LPASASASLKCDEQNPCELSTRNCGFTILLYDSRFFSSGKCSIGMEAALVFVGFMQFEYNDGFTDRIV